jgi:hypothetical protein
MSEKRRPPCKGASANLLPGTLGRVLFDSAIVHAQNGCPGVGPCSGQGWCRFEDQCNTGGPCRGNYQNTYNDQNICYPWGFVYTGGACANDSDCGCVTLQCIGGGPDPP